mmetsp:Transcript_965/g.2705  ORF Transcript_965/g.2705 Transcript_965/m.2705 type:complete len:406 (+) Transcript_965:1876-3093(+)
MDRADIALELNGDHPIIVFFIRSILIGCTLHFSVTVFILRYFLLVTFGALVVLDLRHNGSSRHFESALAFHQVVTESALIHSSVGENNGASSLSLAADPRTFVLLPLGICRDTSTFHGIFAPHPVVAETIGRIEDALTMSLSLVPLARVGRAIGPTEGTSAVGSIVSPVAFIDRSIGHRVRSDAVTSILFEVARVDSTPGISRIVGGFGGCGRTGNNIDKRTVGGVAVSAMTVHPPPLPVAFIHNSLAVTSEEYALAMLLVASPFALIEQTITIEANATAFSQAVVQLAFVNNELCRCASAGRGLSVAHRTGGRGWPTRDGIRRRLGRALADIDLLVEKIVRGTELGLLGISDRREFDRNDGRGRSHRNRRDGSLGHPLRCRCTAGSSRLPLQLLCLASSDGTAG